MRPIRCIRRFQRRQPGDCRCARPWRILIAHGLHDEALGAFDRKFCGPVSAVVLRRPRCRPFGLLNIVDERCGGQFDNIDDVVPAEERNAFMAAYKAAAGFAIDTLNAAPKTIAEGARVSG